MGYDFNLANDLAYMMELCCVVLWVQHGHLFKENFSEARDVWDIWN